MSRVVIVFRIAGAMLFTDVGLQFLPGLCVVYKIPYKITKGQTEG